MHNGIVILTSCSVTRTREPLIKVSDLGTGLNQHEALKKWSERLAELELEHDGGEALISPLELYRGISFQSVLKLIPQVQEVKIVTGGQGLIDINEKIVPYDFTSHKKQPGNIMEAVTQGPYSSALWWSGINEARKGIANPIAQVLNNPETKLVIVVLTKMFWKYIKEDLLMASPEGLAKLRILATRTQLGSLGVELKQYVVLYDARINRILPGNRNDLVQRAAVKLVELINSESSKGSKISGVSRVSVTEHNQLLADLLNQHGSAEASRTQKQSAVQFLLGHKDLLDLGSAEEAFVISNAVGSRSAFITAWNALKEASSLEETSKAESIAGLKALDSLGELSTLGNGEGTEVSAIKMLKVLRESLIAKDAVGVMLDSGVIFEWLKVYSVSVSASDAIPHPINSKPRLAHFLTRYYSVIGFTKTKHGSKVVYSVKV